MWSLLLGLGGTLLQWIMSIYAIMTIKEWIAMAACATCIILAVRAFTSMFDMLKTMLESKVMRWVLGLGTLVAVSFGAGYFSRTPSDSISSEPSSVQEIGIRKYDSM